MGDRLTSVVDPWNQSTATQYNAANLPSQVTAGNGTVTLYGYDQMLRTVDVWHQTGGGSTLGRYQYVYDAASNVTQRSDNDGSVTSFGYDGANQLTSEVRTGSGAYSISLTYDHNANRLTKTLNGVTDAYSYGPHDRLLSTSTKTFGYDLNGNITSVTVGGQTTTLSYDYENRITQIVYPGNATNTFQYNGLGLRTRKVDSAGAFNYVCDGAEAPSSVLADGAAAYTPGLNERRSGISKFYHADALGSTRGVTNAGQSATDGILYDAFGMTVSRTGTTPTPFGFVGAAQYQSDADSGLTLLGHRYYDASVGRFITEDPIRDGENWYAYCGNRPLTRLDAAGLDDKGLLPPDPTTGKRRLPPGYDDGWGNGWDDRGHYVVDPSGRKWYPHPEDGRHWPHYDLDPPSGGLRRYPGKPLKPWPNQKRPPYGDQSPTDPWKHIPDPLPDDPGPPPNYHWRERGAAIAAVVILDALFGCCFDGDTPVLTPDRGPVPIRSLAAGDIVMSWDERTGKAVPAKVMARTQSIVTDDAILRLSGDCAVHMTPNHPVFVAGRGFVPAAKLRTGARCRLLSRGTAAVLYVELRARPPHTVFNLLLRGSHSFFVGTRHLLVHDASGCVALRAAPGHSRPFEPMRRRR